MSPIDDGNASNADVRLGALTRREALGLGVVAGTAIGAPIDSLATPSTQVQQAQAVLTSSRAFVDVSRGNPVPHSLRGEALVKARLTPETWRLEITGEGSASVPNPLTIEAGTALDLSGLIKLAKTHGSKFLKAMQCLNIPQPLGQGLWEGVPLREVLKLAGRIDHVRRIYYWGYHNDDPKQLFQSSLSYTQVMETSPWELPAFLAFRLNGEPLPLVRGGPVRMLIPWSHGFKSIKWLQHIVLTNDFKANDTYANDNNDPESHLKTSAYITSCPGEGKVGSPHLVRGVAISGMSGLKRVETWVRRVMGGQSEVNSNSPEWISAAWSPCRMDAPPADWGHVLPLGMSSKTVMGFDPATGRPKQWPLPYSTVGWTAAIEGLRPGSYEVRARSVDLNGYAQPEPRPYQKSGRNEVEVRRFRIVA